MIDFVLMLDPNTGDLALEDGLPVGAPTVALGLVVFTLRTQLGQCPVAPDLGVDWNVARTAAQGVELALAREIERALRWVEEGRWLTKLEATVTTAGNRLAWAVSFEADGRGVTLRGVR